MDDDDVQEYESGWRKRQISNRDATNIRNATLEEVAQEFESLRIAFGDTAASFAQYVREMKNEWFR